MYSRFWVNFHNSTKNNDENYYSANILMKSIKNREELEGIILRIIKKYGDQFKNDLKD